jgi:hypothetical protein
MNDHDRGGDEEQPPKATRVWTGRQNGATAGYFFARAAN